MAQAVELYDAQDLFNEASTEYEICHVFWGVYLSRRSDFRYISFSSIKHECEVADLCYLVEDYASGLIPLQECNDYLSGYFDYYESEEEEDPDQD